MKFNFNKESGLKVNLVFENQCLDCDKFKVLKEKEIFVGKLKEIYVNPIDELIFVGLGSSTKITKNELREVFFDLAKELESKNIKEISIDLPKLENVCCMGVASAISEGLIQSEYKFDRFKKDKKESRELVVNYTNISEKQIEATKEIQNVMNSVFITRDLVNLPSNYIYPETLANKANELLSPLGVKVSIYDEKQIQEMGMQAFYSVGKGSDNPPRLIVMEYENNTNSKDRLALVGKGITYDSGGYSLKPSDSMKTMFCDMGGAATVIGTIHAIATQKVKTNVVGVIAACENAVSGHSYKPGDIIGSLSGKTIEVDNTDAEGRVTLADSVYYASTTMKATKVIDLATLTGACLIALGEVYTGSVTNNQDFFNEVKLASDRMGEKIWQLPIDPMFAKQNKSKVADIKNTGGRLAGTITAGMFVGEFNNNLPWVHLDIAGTAYLSSAYSYLPEGATGIHVKTLYNLVANSVDCK